MTLRNGLMRRRLKEQIRDQQKDTQRQFHDKAFDERMTDRRLVPRDRFLIHIHMSFSLQLIDLL